MYDLHAHVVGHGRLRESLREKISSYLLAAEMYGFEALGLVDHHESLGAHGGVRQMVEEARHTTDLAVYYGVEIPYPLPRTLPKRFDYTLVHVGRGIDTLDAVVELKKLRKPFIIAHPCAFGSYCSDTRRLIEELADSSISLESSMSRAHLAPQSLLREASEKSIPLVLGSDAHDPGELFSSVPDSLEFTVFSELGFL